MRLMDVILLALIAVGLFGGGCATPSRPQPLAWDVVNLKDNDWSGPPRQMPVIEGDDLVLRGQEVRTQRTYSAPVTVEFDVMLEERLANDGYLTCLFVPATQAVDRDLERGLMLQFRYDRSGDWMSVYELFQHRPIYQGKDWSNSPLTIKPGSWHHLKYEAEKDGLRITVDGQPYNSGGVVVPYDTFYIELSGWQPTNRWHVRNFSVH